MSETIISSTQGDTVPSVPILADNSASDRNLTPSIAPPHKRFPWLIVAVILVLAGIASYFAWAQYQQMTINRIIDQCKASGGIIGESWPPTCIRPNTATPSQSVAPSSSTTTESLPTNQDPNIKTFTSSKLGITFEYQEKYKDNQEVIATKEIGNKVYVYSSLLKPDQGQYVEIFDKDPSNTLEQAITKTILDGYSISDCPLSIDPKNPQIIKISLPDEATQNGMEAVLPYLDKCPARYVSFGGIAYFYADGNQPSKFAFFSIGQYALNAGDDKTWQDTFKFTASTTSNYTCPKTGWVDCEPPLEGDRKKACSEEAMTWYETNCPDFQGGAL